MIKERLDQNDRINLQAGIAKGYSLKFIAEQLKKSRSTIYREIINNCTYKDCRHTCSHCQLNCKDKTSKFKNGQCQIFVAFQCEHWKSFPYTCNNCKESQFCTNRKRYYDCIQANAESVKKRKEPRIYRNINNEDLSVINSIVTDGVKKGQSLHHIFVSNSNLQKICCERTIRRYVYRGYLSVKAHELSRYVRYVKKYAYKERKIVNVERMFGRTFSDYKKYVESHMDENIWQYDSVEGKITDKKAILTITLPEYRFQFGFLIAKQNSKSVFNKMKLLRKLLASKFDEIFQINLSDNGPEFTLFHEIENDTNGNKSCNVFFTTPYKSTDKASCEKNHEFIRYVLPKGKSLDFLTQEKVNLLFSHINSYVRLSNKNKTPYDLAVERFGNEFMEIVGIKKISPKEVFLKPGLLK